MPVRHNKYFCIEKLCSDLRTIYCKKDNTKNEGDVVLGIVMTLCWLGWRLNKVTRNLKKLAEYFESLKSF